MSDTFNLVDIVRIGWKRRKRIVLITGIATVLTALLSLLLPNIFQAKSIIFPASPNSTSRDVLFGGATNAYVFGGTEDMDRVLSIANSKDLEDKLIEQLDLYTHYEVERDAKNSTHRVRSLLKENYAAQKNEFGVIEITFLDKDPAFAALTANTAVENIDLIISEFINSNRAEVLDIYRDKIEVGTKRLAELTDSLTKVRNQYSIYSAFAQGEQIGEIVTLTTTAMSSEQAKLDELSKLRVSRSDTAYINTRTRLAGLRERYNLMMSDSSKSDFNLKNFAEGFELIMSLDEEKDALVKDHALSTMYYQQLQATIETKVPSIFVLEKATPATRKHKPKRSLIVITALLLSFFLSLLASIILENKRTLRKYFEQVHD